MSDEFHGVSKDEYVTDRLLSEQDWADWRAARGYEASSRLSHDEMVAYFAAERAEVEAELESIAERAVVRDGWRTYPDELRAETPPCGHSSGIHHTPDPYRVARVNRYAVHATLQLTGCGDPTPDELRAQLAAIGFDCIDIEEVA